MAGEEIVSRSRWQRPTWTWYVAGFEVGAKENRDPFVGDTVTVYVNPDAPARSTTRIHVGFRHYASLAIFFCGFTTGVLTLLDNVM